MQWWDKNISRGANYMFEGGGGQKYTKYNKIYNTCKDFRRGKIAVFQPP